MRFFPRNMATLWWFLNFAGRFLWENHQPSFSKAKILELETSMAGAATVPWTQGRDGMVGVRFNGSDGGHSTPEVYQFAPEKWWLEDEPFLLGPGNFSGASC